MKRLSIIAAATALALSPALAAACSPAAGYEVPSNLAQVAQAETILLARVIGGNGSGGEVEDWSITIRPLEAIKGELPQGDITLHGAALATVGGNELSNPFEFVRAHPNAYTGACNRYMFPLGTTVLFFLRTDDQGMWAAASSGPFTRWAEDVPDANAPWVQLVRAYAITASLPEAERLPFLEDEREALLARRGEPLAQLMADDIARQIGDDGDRAREESALLAPVEESSVESMLDAMHRNSVEAGN